MPVQSVLDEILSLINKQEATAMRISVYKPEGGGSPNLKESFETFRYTVEWFGQVARTLSVHMIPVLDANGLHSYAAR